VVIHNIYQLLMETHIAFTLSTDTLLQLYLSKRHLSKIANKTNDTLRQQQSQGKDCVVVYKGLNFAVLDLDFYTEIIADPGYYFEHWVGIELWKRIQYNRNGQLSYLRTKSGFEIDYVIKMDRKSSAQRCIAC